MPVLSNIVRVVLIGLLIITPWFFGGVWASVQWVLMLVTAILLAIDLVTRFGDDDRPHLLPVAWLPVLAGIALGLFQLILLPSGLANILAPGAVAWHAELAVDPPMGDDQAASTTASSTGPSRIRRSLYAVPTREYLALLALAAGVLILASLHLVDRQSTLWLFGGLAACGALLSFFGLIQRLSWNGKFYWIFEPVYGGFQSFGPFVNRNNAGGFLNLCLAAGLGLLVWLHRDASADQPPPRRSRRSGRRDRSRGASSESEPRHAVDPRSVGDTSTSTGGADVPTDWSTEQQDRSVDRPREPLEPEPVDRPREPLDGPGQEPAEPVDRPRDSVDRPRDPAEPVDRPRKPLDGPDQAKSSRRRRSSSEKKQDTRFSRAAYPSAYGGGKRGVPIEVNSLTRPINAFFANLNATRLWALAMVAFITGGVLCTASRGSILAMFAAGMATCAALAMQRGRRGYAAGLLTMLVAGGALMSWAGQTDFVRGRFQQMFEADHKSHGRVPHWFESLELVPEFAIAGTGLGTHRYVYERYQQRYLPGTIHTHAENQFVQSLVEGGWIGLALLLSAIGLTALATVRLYRVGGPLNLALAVMGTFGLTSQLVGGFFDFGLYIPSNTILMAAVCGTVVGRAALLSIWPADLLDAIDAGGEPSRYHPGPVGPAQQPTDAAIADNTYTVTGSTRSRRERRTKQPKVPLSRSLLLNLSAPPSLVAFIVGFLFLGCLFGSLEMNNASKIERAMAHAPLSQLLDVSDPIVVARAAAPLRLALHQRWDDAIAHQHLARLQMQSYRAETYQRLLQESRAAADAATPADADATDASANAPADEPAAAEERDEELWARASVEQLHLAVTSADPAVADDLRNDPIVRETLVPAVRHLILARDIAPTIWSVHLDLASLLAVTPTVNQPYEAFEAFEALCLERAQTLAPGDALMWYESGRVNLNSGRIQEACQAWRRSLLLTRQFLDPIFRSARGRLTPRQQLDGILPRQADLTALVAQRYTPYMFPDEPRQQQVRMAFLRAAEERLSETKLPAAQWDYTKAMILRQLDRGLEAIPSYQDAIAQNSTNLAWRYEFAMMLLQLEKYDLAHEQATYLIRAKPKTPAYDRLLRQVNAKRLRAGPTR